MSDLREQLLKAGLVSPKQVRQAKHEERVRRKEVGHEGLEAERVERERLAREAEEAQKRRDQDIEKARLLRLAEEEKTQALVRRIQAGWLRDATAGNRRYYFVVQGERITYLDLADQAVRRLATGSAAIVSSHGAARGEYCLVDVATANSLSRDHADVIVFWNRGQNR